MPVSGGSGGGADDRGPGDDEVPDLWAWWQTSRPRASALMAESIRAGSAAAERWRRRSLEDGEWTVDKVTAEVIADWDELTPLAGSWLDLWLEGVQHGLRTRGRRDDG